MGRRLPPLNALRAFEAGARHLSFTKAAEELFVTQAAVSHQVKLLEQDLGVALFRRLTRKLALTAEGRRPRAQRRAAHRHDAGAHQIDRLDARPDAIAPPHRGIHFVVREVDQMDRVL